MFILNLFNKQKVPVRVSAVEKEDYRHISKNNFIFNWKLEKSRNVYKLIPEDDSIILGLISILHHDSEFRIEIKLLEVRINNVGKNRKFEGIAGCMIAFAAKISILEYGAYAAVSLIPKTELKKHYTEKYGFQQAGISLFLEGEPLIELINKYG